MHLYNAWLPPMVAEETKKEAESFASVVRSVKGSWRPDDPDSVYDTLKWIPIIDLFLRAKSDISPGDVKDLVEFGLKLFHASQGKLYPQVRWGLILITLLKKHGKKLLIAIHWRPFYDNLMLTHFKRNTGPEGWRLREKHIKTVTSLVQSCRKFFPAGSASEIWSEFRYSFLLFYFFLLVKDIKLQRTLKFLRPSDVQGMYLACFADDYTCPENSKHHYHIDPGNIALSVSRHINYCKNAPLHPKISLSLTPNAPQLLRI